MDDNKTLVMLHVIFRHGDRTPDANLYFPKQKPLKPEDYQPYGFGQLTNEGKKTMLNLGKKIRERYKPFLGEFYVSKHVEAWSSNVERTKASVFLVLKGMYPLQTLGVSDLNYFPLEKDNIFLASITDVYKEKFRENFKKSKSGQKILKKHEKLLNYLQEHTGLEMNSTYAPYRVHDLLTTQKSLGISLPFWAESINWGELQMLVAKHYSRMMVETKELRVYLAGRMLEKIINDTKRNIMNDKYTCKICLYSGHDVNIAGILGILNLSFDHIPQFGSCVIFEIYKKGTNYEIQVLYVENPDEDFERMIFPNDSNGCSLEELQLLLDETYLL